jgi:hypothetical protein
MTKGDSQIATSTASAVAIKPFPNFSALDGCHCITSSLARIFHHAGHPLSEEMLLGLGAGMGFVYWRMKFGSEDSVFTGGRSNLKNFYQDLSKRTGVTGLGSSDRHLTPAKSQPSSICFCTRCINPKRRYSLAICM